MSNQNAKVEGFGLTLVDISISTEGEIRLNSKHPIKNQLVQLGGVVPTALVVLSRLGVDCKFHTILGNDTFADMVCGLLEKEKVRLGKTAKIKNGKTPLAVVLVGESKGERTIFYNTANFSSVSAEEFKDALDEGTKLLLLDGHNFETTSELIKKAHERSAKVLLDIGSPKENIERLTESSDIVFSPEAYWQTVDPQLSPEEFVKHLQAQGPEISVLTLGENGAYITTAKEVFHQPAFKVRAVDTNGAGDVFMGAFAYGLLNEWDIRETAKFASAAAAMSCTKLGKDESIPHSEEEIKKFLNLSV